MHREPLYYRKYDDGAVCGSLLFNHANGDKYDAMSDGVWVGLCDEYDNCYSNFLSGCTLSWIRSVASGLGRRSIMRVAY